MRIRTKFSLFTGLVIVATTGAVATLGYLHQKSLIERHRSEIRESQSAGFASVCRQALTINDDLLMVNYAKLLQESPSIVYAYFVDDREKIVVHSDSRYFHKPLSEWSKPSGAIESSTAVYLGRRPAGHAVVGFSEAYQQKALRQALDQTLKQVAAAAFLVALLGLAAAVLFAYFLTGPLKALAQGSREIGKGNFNTQVRVAGSDEIGELTERFNSMARSLAVLDEMKDEFISNVSHDLRNPMSAVEMYLDFMLYSDEDRNKVIPKHKEILLTVSENVKRLGLFVNNLLDAAKIKAGRMEYRPGPVSLEAVSQNIQKLYGIVAQKQNLHLLAEIPLNLPSVWADRERLEHVIANLISNAIKFTPPNGRITLGARENRDRIECFIADTGKGIPEKDLSLLFRPFSQSGVTDQKAKGIKGTGLGLYIVKKTVEDMGGAVSVDSTEGKGTRFTLTLPKAPSNAKPASPINPKWKKP